jgi:hypothetical protein
MSAPAVWQMTEIKHPGSGALILGLWLSPLAADKRTWVIARWEETNAQWLITWRPDGGLAPLIVPARDIAWWTELPVPPAGVEIAEP